MAAKNLAAVIQQSYKAMGAKNNFSRLLGAAKVTTAQPGEVRLELPVDESLTNHFGTLHGGATATLIDVVTTHALLTKRANPGVTVDLHVTYATAVPQGETVEIIARVLRVGRTKAFLQGELVRKSNGALVATGLHTKELLPQLEGIGELMLPGLEDKNSAAKK